MAAAPGLAELDRIEAQLREAEAEYCLRWPSSNPSSSSSSSRPSSRTSPPKPKVTVNLNQPLYSHSPRPTTQLEGPARVDAALFSRLQRQHHPSSRPLPTPTTSRSAAAAAAASPHTHQSPIPPPSSAPQHGRSIHLASTASRVSTTTARRPSSSSSSSSLRPAEGTSQPRTHASRSTLSQSLSRLAQPRHEIYAERERQRQEREAAKAAQENCTFKPTLCLGTEKRAAAAAAAAALGKGEIPKSLPERLKERQEATNAARRRRQVQLEKERLRECTFQPVLFTDGSAFLSSSPSSSPSCSPTRRAGHDNKPLHERLGDVQRARRDHLDRLRAQAEEERAAEWTFRPRLCEVTEEMARQRRQDQDEQYAYDRCIHEEEEEEEEEGEEGRDQWGVRMMGGTTFDHLAQESQRFLQRRMAKRWALEQEQLAECHFAPRLCEKTEELIAKAGLPADFASRQHVWDEHRQRKAAVIEATLAAEEERWFKPALEPYSEAMVARLRERWEQQQQDDGASYDGNGNTDDYSPAPVVQRLAVKETARREAAQQHRTEAFYAQYRFQPSLNPVSRALGRPSTTDELAYNWRGEMARNKVAEEAQARFDAECTFQPVLPSSSSSSSSSSLPAASTPPQTTATGTKAGGRRTGNAPSGSTSAAAVATNKAVRVAPAPSAQAPVSIAAGWEDRRRAKDALAAEARAAREAEELQACTWQPQLATKAIPSRRRQEQQQSPVLVRGLGKFLARTQAAAQQREERAAAVVALSAGGTKRSGAAGQQVTTMPRPFQLSSRPQGQRGSQANVRAEVARLAQATLTFRPQTIERRKQAALQRLLEGGV